MERITLYTSAGCTLCQTLKNWLTERSVGFVEKDLLDSDVMSTLVMSNVFIMSAPALEANGRFYTVDEIFSGERLNEELLEQTFREEVM